MLAQINIISNRIDPNLQNPSDAGKLLEILVSRALTYAIALAGLYFFVRLIIAGFTLLTSTGDPAKLQAAQKELLHSLIGLVIVITAFFLGQILQYITGVNIGV